MKFFRCKTCGNIVTHVKSSGVPVMCCGAKMEELIPGSVDAAAEKHVPAVAVNGNVVTAEVGSVPHPMVEEHFIEWIAIESEQGAQIKYLNPKTEPKAVFALAEGDKVKTVYEYCNLHGLWKAEC